MLQSLLHLTLGLLPVLCFLIALVSLDSFRLVRFRTVLLLLAAGAVAAGISLPVHRSIVAASGIERATLARYVAPLVEETLKATVVVYLIARRRVGFLVDAAITGFAVGAGFAALENIHFLMVLEQPRLGVWLVRGFGTAIMHGGVTASMAIISKSRADRRGRTSAWSYAPGWLLAVILHSVFNHFFLTPDLSTLVLLTVLPLVFVQVFRVSEKRTREWLGTGFDTDVELLQIINEGKVSESRVGEYLRTLQERFSPTTVADMICLLRLRLELSLRAKGILILREAGAVPSPDPEVREKFVELRYLEKSIGHTGLAALHPILHFSDQDLWQYHLLQSGGWRGSDPRVG